MELKYRKKATVVLAVVFFSGSPGGAGFRPFTAWIALSGKLW